MKIFSVRLTSLFGLLTFLVLFGASSEVAFAQDGEKLFKSYCAACHSPGSNQLVGPGLAGVEDRYDKEWLYKWIKNSQELVKSGDAQAIEVYEKYNELLMPAQPVNNEDIDAILAYVKEHNTAKAETEAAAPAGGSVEVDSGSEADSGDQTTYIVLGSVLILLILISVLRKVQHSLQIVEARKKGEEVPEELSMWKGFQVWINGNKKIVALIGIVLIALVAKAGWDAALKIGIYEGYEPEQPIKFSHKLHAGDNGIDCNYCHSSASFSKSAGIPSPNLCMNCHTYIQEGPQYGKEEIAKIYEALDFDPVTKTYGDDQKPIKWVKVHNLPDHVYFNHSQHVTVGKIACQKCHGPVETFTVGKQHADLTMGWCISCHRETKVQMEGNEYYDEIHRRLPEDLKKQYLEDGTITVSELGGIECAKCHY
jgi:mono/diheme cytochrome c family protein